MKDDAERARERLGKLVAESGRYSSVASHAFSTQGRDIFILASDAIELAVAFTQQPGGWRPIETAPKDGEPILIWKPNERMVGEYMMAAYWDNSDEPGFVPVGGQHRQGYLSSVTGTPQGFPTHWQPLPAPPAAMLDVAPIPGEE